jgi:hypothetical protein
MNVKPPLQPLGLAVLLLAPLTTLRGADVHGEHENPNQAFGQEASYRLDGDTKFGWRTGTLTGDIGLNGHAFVIDTGGGNRTVFSGAIVGQGSFEWNGGGVPQVAPSILSGDKPNTFQGVFRLSRGVLDLDKPPGVDAIPGDLVVGTKASAVVRLQKPDQINDAADVTLGGAGISGLDLQGHNEKFASLTLKTHAEITMGEKSAALVVGDSSARAWDLTKTMTVRGFKPGKDKLVFGQGDSGLSKAQLARIGFASPAGMADGLYTAKIGSDGQLAPDALVKAANPPFDVSPAAIAARAKLYDVPGLASLSGQASPLQDGMTIDFFGDSITWQNGFIGAIDNAIKTGAGTRGRSVKLVNRGINGGGVLQARDGSTNSAFPGNSAQQPFAEVIASDKADLCSKAHLTSTSVPTKWAWADWTRRRSTRKPRRSSASRASTTSTANSSPTCRRSSRSAERRSSSGRKPAIRAAPTLCRRTRWSWSGRRAAIRMSS